MQKSFPVIAGCCLLGVTLWLQLTSFKPVVHFITRLEALAYDLQLQTRRLTPPLRSESPVVIVDIDDQSIAREGRWPWPRAKLSTLINQLKAAGAAVVAFDIIFPEAETNPANIVIDLLKQKEIMTPTMNASLEEIIPALDNDARFAQGLSSMDTILGVSFLPSDEKEGMLPASPISLPTNVTLSGLTHLPGYLANIPSLQKAAKSGGFINMFPDDDGIVRRTALLVRHGDRLYPSLALEAIRVYLLSRIQLKIEPYYDENRLEEINVGNHIIPTDEKAQVLIPFQGRSFSFPYYSASLVMRGLAPANSFTGKIVFVGTSATSLSDLRATSIQNVFPGVEIHATIASGILNNSFSSHPSWEIGAEVSLTFLSGLLFIFLFPIAGPRLITVLIIAIPLSLLFLNSLLWEKTGIVFSVFMPASFAIFLGIINILYGYFFESRHREKLRAMFGQYVPEKHITEMLSRPSDFTLYGEDRNMTVLFADIRNFTHISEGLSADQLKDLLNAFFTAMTEVIFKYNGTIDKYIGDMIMAFWGAPLPDPNHAQHALMAALEMQKTVRRFLESAPQGKWPDIRMGIGLNTGIMSVGDMGSQFRRNYTVLGDSVNLGSRAEGLTKFYGVDIIATKNTCDGQDAFIFRRLDRVRVKGKKIGIDIYEPLCLASALTETLKEEVDLYHVALNLYFAQSFQESNEAFKKLSVKYPHTRLYQIYLQRTQSYLAVPPPSDWDGVYVHTNK